MQSLAAVLIVLVAASASADSATDVAAVLRGAEPAAHDAAARLSAAGKNALSLVIHALGDPSATAEQRARLVGVLAHMKPDGTADAANVLGQIVLNDGDGLVRAEAEWTLKHWAVEKGDRGDRARAELRLIDAARGRSAPG